MNALCDCFWWSANNSDDVIGQLLLFSGEWSSVRACSSSTNGFGYKGQKIQRLVISFVDLGF
jgi:hypothetical protein